MANTTSSLHTILTPERHINQTLLILTLQQMEQHLKGLQNRRNSDANKIPDQQLKSISGI